MTVVLTRGPVTQLTPPRLVVRLPLVPRVGAAQGTSRTDRLIGTDITDKIARINRFGDLLLVHGCYFSELDIFEVLQKINFLNDDTDT